MGVTLVFTGRTATVTSGTRRSKRPTAQRRVRQTLRRRGCFFALGDRCRLAAAAAQRATGRLVVNVQEKKRLTGRIAAEQIKLMAVPQPPAGVVERFLALGDPTGVISDTMDEL